jgi:phosphatidylglycerophosphate synthase
MSESQARPMNTAPESDRFFTLANIMSLSRVPLAGVFWLTLRGRPEATWAPLIVMLVAGATDILDGKFARQAHRDLATGPLTGRGAWLDPLCDKIFVGVVLMALFIERALTVNLLLLIYARELIQIPTSLGYKLLPAFRGWLHYNFTATVLGKLTTVLQFATIVSLLFNTRATLILALASCCIGLLAVGDYLWRVVRIARQSPR